MKRHLIVLCTLAAVALALVAAGVAGARVQADANGVAVASRMVAQAEAPAKWLGPSAKLDVAKLRGKSIWYINLDQSIPHLATIGNSLAEAAAKAGVKVVQFDGKSQVKEWSRGVQQAIAAKADVIVPLAVPLNAISAPLDDARKAGIKVVAALYTDANVPLPKQFRAVAQHQMTEEYVQAGALEAAWVVKDSQGDANVLVFHSPELSVTAYVTKGIRDTFKRTCPDCKLTWKSLPVAQWSTQLATLTRTALTSDRNLDYIIPIYDGMANFIIPAVHQAGAGDRVKISTFNATKPVMQSLKRGDVVGADSGTQGPWEGWALADASFRALLGAKPVKNYKIPLRLFTAENIDEIDLNKPEDTWYGSVDFKGRFLKLWSLER
jgi:ribose transport system substrate-binding protein